MALRDAGFDNKAGDFPKMKRGAEFTTHLTVARNSSHIKTGETLLLPFFDQSESCTAARCSEA